jgi:hypothetical protein
MPRLGRPSPALIVATIALFAAVGGGAWAAGHTAAHHSVRARAAASSNRGPRGFTGARGPRGRRGFTGAPGPAGAAGPSDGFVISVPQATDLPGGTDTVVTQLSVPAGATYIVNASTDLGNATNTPSPISCTLLQNSNPLTSGSASLPGQLLFAATIALNTAVDAANGTNVKLSCNPDSNAKARNSVITAIRVGTLHTETATP